MQKKEEEKPQGPPELTEAELDELEQDLVRVVERAKGDLERFQATRRGRKLAAVS